MGIAEKTDSEIAFHEAGHAVAALFSFVPFRCVTIISEDESLRHVLLAASPKWFRHDEGVTDRALMYARRRLVVDFAGQIAEGQFAGRPPNWGMESNDTAAAVLALDVCGSPQAAEAFMQWCWCLSSETIDAHWGEVAAVASALLKRKTLSVHDVREIVWPRNSAVADRLNRVC